MVIDCPGHACHIDAGKSSYDLFKPTKPFNQFASEMAVLSERLRKLDTRIRSARNDDLVKRGVTKGLKGAVTQIIS